MSSSPSSRASSSHLKNMATATHNAAATLPLTGIGLPQTAQVGSLLMGAARLLKPSPSWLVSRRRCNAGQVCTGKLKRCAAGATGASRHCAIHPGASIHEELQDLICPSAMPSGFDSQLQANGVLAQFVYRCRWNPTNTWRTWSGLPSSAKASLNAWYFSRSSGDSFSASSSSTPCRTY